MRTIVFFSLFASCLFGSSLVMAQTALNEGPRVEISHPDENLLGHLIGDNNVRFSQADMDGLYSFRDFETGEKLDLIQDEFSGYMKKKLANRTIIERQGAHGWLAEYSTEDGRVFMWYPGNRKVMPGFWKVESVPVTLRNQSFSTIHICFQYPTGYNYVENKPGKNWDCWPASESIAYPENRKNNNGLEVREGDVFNLQTGKIPFVLKRNQRPAWPDEVK